MTSAGTSDPYAVVTRIATEPGETPRVLGRTEVVSNTQSPTWAKKFLLDFDLGTTQKLVVSVYHKRSDDDAGSESMGATLFDVGKTLGARGSTKAKRIKGDGTVFATIRPSQGEGSLRLKLKGEGLKNVEGIFRKSDPFYEIYRNVDNAGGDTWELQFRSEVVKDELDPEWDEQTLELSQLCGGNLDLPLRCKFFDFERSGDHVPMGMLETTVNKLVEAHDEDNRNMTLLQKGDEVGEMIVELAEVALPSDRDTDLPAPASAVEYERKPSFVDYINGGCKLSVVVAIDYTGSNGNPMEPGTLHYLDPEGGLNDYQKAIKAILGILSEYDDDQKFPTLGFGAKFDGDVDHCFQCGPEPEAEGVDGVLEAYRSVFSSGLIMSKPTDFTGVIDAAISRSQMMQEQAEENGKQAYTILLIVSDGAVADADATMEALERAADAPLSIVIVGVGDEDFSDMQFLDDGPAKFGRDMVQFVEFNQHCDNSQALTSHTLHEIPTQLVSYFQSRGIGPLPPEEMEEEEIVVEAEEEEEIDLSLNVDEEEIVVSGGGVNVYDALVP